MSRMSHGIHTYIHRVRAGPCSSQKRVVKVRPEDFLFTSVHLAPKMLYAICSYPWSKHSVSDTHTQFLTQPYSSILVSSTAAAFSQRRQNSSSCSHGQTPRCILSLHLIYPRVQLQQQRRLRAFCSLQNTITFNTFHTFFYYPGTETDKTFSQQQLS